MVEGKAEGKAEGKIEGKVDLVKIKLAKGQSVEQIADALEESQDYIMELIQNGNNSF